jgi:hypothetical protein
MSADATMLDEHMNEVGEVTVNDAPWENLPSLTQVHAMELDMAAAQRLIMRNVQILVRINEEMMHWSSIFGQAKLEIDKLKYAKSTIVEINRALKTVCDNG